MLPYLFYSTNVLDLELVAKQDLDEMLSVARQRASRAKLIGGTSTSLEEVGTELEYRLVDGRAVAEHIPVLQALYESSFKRIAERVFDRELIVSPDLVSGANVNVLEGTGGRYEWHFDSNPYTGLLVLSPSSSSLGGRLLFGRDPDDQVAVSMRPGDLLFFDARKAAHAVEALKTARVRATVPMNYFVKGEAVVRPPDLDATLYGKR